MIIIWVIFVFNGAAWEKTSDSYSNESICKIQATVYENVNGKPAVCRERSVPAPPN